MALWLMYASLLLLAATWARAAAGGVLPDGPWGVYAGNHGPWRRIYDLRYLVFMSCFALPSVSATLGALALVLRPSLRTTVTFLVVAGIFIGIFVSFYWLVD